MTLKKLVPYIAAIAGGAIAFLLAWQNATPEISDWTLAARYTARVSFLIFLFAFTASALLKIWRNDFTKSLVAVRRHTGLGFSLAHTIHLYALIMATVVAGYEVYTTTLIGGGLGYVFVFAMAATSNDAAQRALGANWRRLHLIGVWYLWFIFIFIFAGRLGQNRVSELAVVLAILAAGLRITTYMQSRRKRG